MSKAGWIAFVIAVVGAIVLRVIDIDIRPFHNDEGVNFHFVEEIRNKGYYPYSHQNYHGPAYFYLTTALANSFGDSELGMRMSAILCGVLLLVLITQWARVGGWWFVATAALLSSCSASLVFYSRYAIHEPLYLLGSFWAASALFLWIRVRGAWTIYSGFLGLVVLITTKETFIICLASLAFATVAAAGPRAVYEALLRDRKHLGLGSLLAIALVCFIFSGGFQWVGGLREMILAVPQWIGRGSGDYGHFKPFFYYTGVMARTEPISLVAFLIPVIGAILWPGRFFRFFMGDSAAGIRFLTGWFVTAWLAYSWVQYKTPWLIINITFPALLCVAWWISLLAQRTSGALVPSLCASLAIVGQCVGMVQYNFIVPYGPLNPFSYTHTSPGMVELLADIDEYWKTNPKARILVGVNQYWPLPYYFRKNSSLVGYPRTNNLHEYDKEYDVIILDKTAVYDEPEWRKKYYRLSDVQESNTYFRVQTKESSVQ